MIKKTTNTLILSLLIFFLIELSLQIRSQIKTGQNVFNVFLGGSVYRLDDQSKLLMLRPNTVTSGVNSVIRSNSYGLRDDDFALVKPDNEIRIALVGASTVMGASATSNNTTLPAQLEFKLKLAHPDQHFKVINAGITGFGLADQRLLISTLIAKMQVDLLIIYTGFNDMSSYCQISASTSTTHYALPKLSLPKWLLSIELLIKNTSALRKKPVISAKTKAEYLKDPATLSTSDYEKSLLELIATAKQASPVVILLGNARSFRREMPEEQQEALSQSARYYNNCFDTQGLHDLYDRHNAIIEAAAALADIEYFNMNTLVPGGAENFTDASHLSDIGSSHAAGIIATKLSDLGYIFINNKIIKSANKD